MQPLRQALTTDPVPLGAWVVRICSGNERRVWREALSHPAARLAEQYAILADDAYWEGL
jgi:hypothetical protein